MNKLTAEMARAVLIGARDRARKMTPDRQVMILRAGTFLSVLKADPSLISYEKLIVTGEFVPLFDNWRIVFSSESYTAPAQFREKIVSAVGGGYLLPVDQVEAVA